MHHNFIVERCHYVICIKMQLNNKSCYLCSLKVPVTMGYLPNRSPSIQPFLYYSGNVWISQWPCSITCLTGSVSGRKLMHVMGIPIKSYIHQPSLVGLNWIKIGPVMPKIKLTPPSHLWVNGFSLHT